MADRLRFFVRACFALSAIALASIGAARAKPPPEAFGNVPGVRSLDLSPDGTRVAFVNQLKGVDYLVLHDFRTGKSEPLISILDVNPDGVARQHRELRRFFGLRVHSTVDHRRQGSSFCARRL